LGEILQPQPAPWLYSVKRMVWVMLLSTDGTSKSIGGF